MGFKEYSSWVHKESDMTEQLYHLFAFLPQNLLGFLSTPSPLFLVKSYGSCSCLANFPGFQLFSAYHILL